MYVYVYMCVSCRYDDLYSTVGGKPLLECPLSAQYLMLGITIQVQFQLFFESRKGFSFPNRCRTIVPGTWTSDLKGPIAHFYLGSWHETSEEFHDLSRHLLQLSDSGLIIIIYQ